MAEINGATAAGQSPVQPSSINDRENAQQLVAAATDSRTGFVDTRQLAQWVADAGKQSFGTASRAHAEIEAVLSDRNPMDAARFNQDVAKAFQPGNGNTLPPLSAPVWVAGEALGEAGRGVLRENPILTVRWTSTENLNGKSGFTSGLRGLLESKGIEVDSNVRPRPAEVVSNARADRALNGTAAQNAISAEFNTPPNSVRLEVTEQTPLVSDSRPTGQRRVDIVVDRPGATPETATRLDIESKLGRPGLDSETRMEVNKDAWRLTRNSHMRTLGRGLDVVGKAAKPVGVIVDAFTIGNAIQADGGEFGPTAQRTSAGVAGGIAGGAGGAWGGAAAGAAIGSVVPGIGTVAGGIVGGIIGAFGGSWLGESAGHGVYDMATQP